MEDEQERPGAVEEWGARGLGGRIELFERPAQGWWVCVDERPHHIRSEDDCCG